MTTDNPTLAAPAVVFDSSRYDLLSQGAEAVRTEARAMRMSIFASGKSDDLSISPALSTEALGWQLPWQTGGGEGEI